MASYNLACTALIMNLGRTAKAEVNPGNKPAGSLGIQGKLAPGSPKTHTIERMSFSALLCEGP